MIDQVTVFIENDKGRLASLCRALGDAGINLHALMVADTSEFGIVRIICDAPEKARDVLTAADYRATITKVAAIEVPDRPGGLADVLEFLDEADVNVEYAYCFVDPNHRAVDVLKVDGVDILEKLTAAGFRALQPVDLYSPEAL